MGIIYMRGQNLEEPNSNSQRPTTNNTIKSSWNSCKHLLKMENMMLLVIHSLWSLVSKLEYLKGIFTYLNSVNISMQESDESILTLNNKMVAFNKNDVI